MVMKKRSAWHKNNRREIKHTWERYLAIVAIIALGVGFFAGLKVTKTAMVNNLDGYVDDYQMYDFRLLSTMGLSKEDVEFFNTQEGMKAEGSTSVDFIADMTINGEEKSLVLRAHSITKSINQLALLEGRMPETENEVVLDGSVFTKDILGSLVPVSRNNSEETIDMFRFEEYRVVGLVNSVNYLNYDLGTTNLADGSLYAFMYIPEMGFDTEYYSEIMVRFDGSRKVYSQEYEDFIADREVTLKADLESRTRKRYQDMVDEVRAEIDKAEEEYQTGYEQLQLEVTQYQAYMSQGGVAIWDVEQGIAEAEEELAKAKSQILEAEETVEEIAEPKVYVLNRNYNSGYVNFDNDSSIVDDIAKILPIFFFLVAALVCTTTMTRMVDEQRTQIGTLKALGYSNGAITKKYMFYSASAAMIGCAIGFLLGSKYFPMAIWEAYGMIYRFSPIEYVFDLPLAIISIVVSFLCSAGVTFLSCRSELLQMPASLIRPKAPKAGKRVFMERIPVLWKRVSFLHKVSIRNILRYKRRFFMTITGIAGCSALTIAALGIRDSIKNVANDQFGSIMVYDYNISFVDEPSVADREEYEQTYAEELSDTVFVFTDDVETVKGNRLRRANIVVTDDMDIMKMVGLQLDGNKLDYPEDETLAISNKLAKEFGIQVGDLITLRVNDLETADVEVSGIFENYFGNYIFMTAVTYEEVFKEAPVYRSAYAKTRLDDHYFVSAKLLNDENVAAVSVTKDIRQMVDDMMKSLDTVIGLVMAFAVALGFVVIYNLNNINITERSREIATLKVIGFYQRETGSYIFRESLSLTVIGAMIGLVLGKLLHMFIMKEINVEMVSFKEQIFGVSYVLAFLITCVITLLVNAMLQKKIDRVNMTESLKSVE